MTIVRMNPVYMIRYLRSKKNSPDRILNNDVLSIVCDFLESKKNNDLVNFITTSHNMLLTFSHRLSSYREKRLTYNIERMFFSNSVLGFGNKSHEFGHLSVTQDNTIYQERYGFDLSRHYYKDNPNKKLFISIPYIRKLNLHHGNVWVDEHGSYKGSVVGRVVRRFINCDYNIEKYSNLVYCDFKRII